MKKQPKNIDIDKLEQATSEGFAIIVGMLAEMAGPTATLLQFRAALDAAASLPNRFGPMTVRLLQDAYRMVLIKARNDCPQPVIARVVRVFMVTQPVSVGGFLRHAHVRRCLPATT